MSGLQTTPYSKWPWKCKVLGHWEGASSGSVYTQRVASVSQRCCRCGTAFAASMHIFHDDCDGRGCEGCSTEGLYQGWREVRPWVTRTMRQAKADAKALDEATP